jgi:hypothetical protein
VKGICDAVAEKGLEKDNRLIEKNGDSESEDINDVNKPIYTYIRTFSYLTHFFPLLYSYGVKLITTVFSICDSVALCITMTFSSLQILKHIELWRIGMISWHETS